MRCVCALVLIVRESRGGRGQERRGTCSAKDCASQIDLTRQVASRVIITVGSATGAVDQGGSDSTQRPEPAGGRHCYACSELAGVAELAQLNHAASHI